MDQSTFADACGYEAPFASEVELDFGIFLRVYDEVDSICTVLGLEPNAFVRNVVLAPY